MIKNFPFSQIVKTECYLAHHYILPMYMKLIQVFFLNLFMLNLQITYDNHITLTIYNT